MEATGFILLRCVNNELTNQYWNYSYASIRKYYPEMPILIIDDNSNYKYVKSQHNLYKTTVIQGEYPGRGELLPYYYYLHNPLFETAVIIHDSVFLNSELNINTHSCKFLWHFEHHWDQIADETKMINAFNDPEVLEHYKNKSAWIGCFGGMSIIKHDHLTRVNAKCDISKLLDFVKTRYNRMSFERVIACLLQIDGVKESMFGNIMHYGDSVNRRAWGTSFNDKHHCLNLPIIKVWTGR
jgi:hypothetical protein